MSKSFKRFYEKLFNIFGKNSLNSNNSNTNFNTKKIMSQIIIRKGHYKNINSGEIGNKDIPIEVIKIIGEDENKPGYWKTDELIKRNNVLVNKSISEHELINDWVFMNTAPSSKPTKILPKSLLIGLEDSNDSNEIPENESELELNEIPLYKPYENINQNQKENLIPEDEKFIHNVLSKIKIQQKESIELKIRIPIDYNFIKLKETINLLNLDINKVINFILSSEETKLLINEKMKDKIFEMLMEENIKKFSSEEIKNIQVIEPEEIIVNNLEIKDLMRSQLPNNELKNQTITSTEDIRIKTLLDKVSKYY